MDAADPLRGFRERFLIPEGTVYLDGNSLGCLPRGTVDRVASLLRGEWGERMVRGWDEGWLELPMLVGDEIGAAALGAAGGQVVVGDSTTVCFYKLASAALQMRPGRDQIITDVDNFPTDRYVLEGLAAASGCEVLWWRGDPWGGPAAEKLADLVGKRTALLTFSHVSYRSAHIADMAAINSLAREAGALTLWDLRGS